MNARVNVIYWLSEVLSTSIRHFFFSFSFSFYPPVTRPEKKIITEIRWFRYSCERIESEYFTNTMTSQHINSSGIRMFHCHIAFLRIVTYLKFSISGRLFKLIIKSKPDLISRASLPPIIK